MIETDRLSKIYRTRKRGLIRAADAVSLTCAAGQIYGLLGPNGAGKTTLLRILSTLIAPSSGDATVGGQSVCRDPAAVRRLVGVVSGETRPYERMTPREIGRFFGRLNGLSVPVIERNLERIIALLGMGEIADERSDGFSTGMKQKTVILRALVTDPRVLIFDEPTSGLDVLAARSMLDHLRLLRAEGRTILFSTHILAEAERLADRIGIIHRGTLVAEGSLAELSARTGHDELEDIFFGLVQDDDPGYAPPSKPRMALEVRA